MEREKLEKEIEEIRTALLQLSHHPCKGTRDWDNCVKWLTELLEIKEAKLTNG